MPCCAAFDKSRHGQHSAVMKENSAHRTKFDHIMQLIQQGALSEAQTLIDNLRRLTPRDGNILNLAAWLATLRGDHNRAIALYKQVLIQHPNQPNIRFNLHRAEAIIAENNQDIPAALTALHHAAALVPQDGQVAAQIALLERQACLFTATTQPTTNLLNPAAAMVLLDDPHAQYKNACHWAQQQFSAIKPLPPRTHHHNADTPIRLGFLSSDWHDHATAYLIAEVFELLDPQRFTPFIYNYGHQEPTAIRRRIQAACPRFHDGYGMDSATIAHHIRADAIDILIDLKGYTRGGRLDILAYRPAPLQLHWLGFPGTLGCPFIDYFIADPTVLPPNLRPDFSENILYLPDCYQCNDRKRPLPTALPRSMYGLPDHALVFASFNQTYKLHPDLLQIWANILQETPQSVLWLLASNGTAPDQIRAFFAARGIATERLFFAPPTTLHDHLQRYHHVDIALDTFPIGGHTTTSDALWLGVPVVTMAAQSFVSRVATSLLHATDYQALALTLAKDKPRRASISHALTTNRHHWPLFDSDNFVKQLMGQLELIWARHQQGLPPEDCPIHEEIS
jgi:protein O-GlcNAc transferase